jgi:protein-histidine N-methyltransferase
MFVLVPRTLLILLFSPSSWAVSTVMTRQNLVPTKVNGLVEDLPALIPFWDMANHKDDVVTTGYNEELQQIESAALTDYKKGEQIFIHYGNRNNVDLMIHNGFVYPENKHDSLPIRLSLSTADELYEERTQLLAKLSIPPTGDLLLLKAPKCISDQLLGFIRVFNMDKGDSSKFPFTL